MRFTDDASYAAAPAEVFELIRTAEFHEDKCVRSRALTHEVAVESTASGDVVIRTTRVMSTQGLPEAARSWVGESLSIVETQTWSAPEAAGGRTAVVTLHVTGQPVRLTGTRRLVPTDEGTKDSFSGELNANIPFIGGKIERAALPALKAGIDVEHTLIQERLSP